MCFISLLDESIAVLFLAFLRDVEDMPEQINVVLVEFQVETATRFRL